MKKRIFLVLLLAAGLISGYRWYSQQPAQLVNGVVDLMIDAVEYDTTTFRQRSDVHDAVREVLAEKIEIQIKGGYSIPQETMSLEQVLRRLDFFHALPIDRKFTEVDQAIMVAGSEAQVTRTYKIKVPNGNGSTQTWELVFDLERSDKWRIIKIRGNEL